MHGSKIRFYLIVIVPAAVLMALEIVSSRLLAPAFGSSVNVWGSIISVFLAAMSVGYFWGGRLADRDPRPAKLGAVLLAATFFQAGILLFGETLVSAISNALGSGAIGTLVAAIVIFAPPTIPMAMVAPFVIRIAASDLKGLGSTAGHLYALSTAGSLMGTLGATFLLIPNLALNPIFSLLMAANALSALILLLPEAGRERLKITLGVCLLILALVPEHLLHNSDLEIVAKRLTAYQTLKVVETGGIRYLYSDNQLHGAVDTATGQPSIRYPKEVPAAYLFQPDIRRVALIGVGSGSVGNYLLAADPELEIDQVDVDQAVIDFAVEYFNAPSGEQNRLHVADGRRFLSDRPDQRWDLIYLDTYIGQSIPFHLSTEEFFELVKSRLNPGGVVGLNLASSPESPLGLGMLRTMSEVFRYLYVFQIAGGNHLFIATSQGPRLTPEDLTQRGRELDQRFKLEVTGVEMAGDFLPMDLDLSTADVFKDSFAPVNHIALEGH